MNDVSLNLARKWRSKNFDEIIGQDISIRLIKNSLYRNVIFPVYLLSGTKGCGKTSTARLFAAALNCSALEIFQKNPQQVTLPCLECISCQAMRQFQHPDVIEIDAASHTGVDNIRTLIETASFVPSLGKKKIYLIDEAHMLSKAAFNALLKILEEPPQSVIFMLATTDAPKILDTVRSRCFQLFFYPIAHVDLVKQLASICDQENIRYEHEALTLLAQESEGSMRDAINFMERVRLSQPIINKQAVLESLGFIDHEHIYNVLRAVLKRSSQEVLQLCVQLNLERYNILLVWKKLIDVVQKALLLYHGINRDQEKQENLKTIIETCSKEDLIKVLEICCSYELILAKTAIPAVAFQAMLLKLCQESLPKELNKNKIKTDESLTTVAPIAPRVSSAQPRAANTTNVDKAWSLYLEELDAIGDPMVASVFKQSTYKLADKKSNILEISFGQELLFFKELLENTKAVWQPIIKKHFGLDMQLVARFDDVSRTSPAPAFVKPVVSSPQVATTPKVPRAQSYKTGASPVIDVSNAQAWPKAHTLLKIFPGTVTYDAQKESL